MAGVGWGGVMMNLTILVSGGLGDGEEFGHVLSGGRFHEVFGVSGETGVVSDGFNHA